MSVEVNVGIPRELKERMDRFKHMDWVMLF